MRRGEKWKVVMTKTGPNGPKRRVWHRLGHRYVFLYILSLFFVLTKSNKCFYILYIFWQHDEGARRLRVLCNRTRPYMDKTLQIFWQAIHLSSRQFPWWYCIIYIVSTISIPHINLKAKAGGSGHVIKFVWHQPSVVDYNNATNTTATATAT